MPSRSLKVLFAGAAVLIIGCLALAGIVGYLLLTHVTATLFAPPLTLSLSTLDYVYLTLMGIALAGIGVTIWKLYRTISTAVRHDIESLARMFHDVRSNTVRPSYPITLREFNHIYLYLRESGQKLVREKATLKDLGLIDHLSQLSNRRHFERRLAELFEAAKGKGPSSVLLIDLDHFKAVNDTHGHDAGDALIVEFAKALRACVRQTDFLARLGGDEFCIIYPYDSVAKAEKYVQRLRQQLPREIAVGKGVTHALRWTGGVSEITDADDKYDQVLWRADKALFLAKAAGRNNTKVFDPRRGLEEPRLILAS